MIRRPDIKPELTGKFYHEKGYGFGNVTLDIPNPDLVPGNHTFEIRFKSPTDSIRADSYEMYDVTNGRMIQYLSGKRSSRSWKRTCRYGNASACFYKYRSIEADSLNSGFLPNTSNLVLKSRSSSTTTPSNVKSRISG